MSVGVGVGVLEFPQACTNNASVIRMNEKGIDFFTRHSYTADAFLTLDCIILLQKRIRFSNYRGEIL